MTGKRRKRRNEMKTCGVKGEVTVRGRCHTCFKRVPVPRAGTHLRACACVCVLQLKAESSFLSNRLFRTTERRTEAHYSIQTFIADEKAKDSISVRRFRTKDKLFSLVFKGHTWLTQTHTQIFVFEHTDTRVWKYVTPVSSPTFR